MVDLVEMSELRSEIAPELPGALRPTIDRAIRQAADDFSRKSRASRHYIDPITLVAGIWQYELDEDSNLQILEIKQALYKDNNRVHILSQQLMNGVDPDWRGKEGTLYACCPSTDRLSVEIAYTPTQVEVQALSLEVVFAPTRKATKIDALLADQYFGALRHGALANLRMMRDAAFYDPDQANFHRFEFSTAIESAKLDAVNGRVARNTTVAYGGL